MSSTALQAMQDRQTYDRVPYVSNGSGGRYLKSNCGNLGCEEYQTVDIMPFSGYSTQLFQSQSNFQIIYDLSNCGIDIPERFYLRMVLNNSDGTNPMTLVNPYWLFQQLQIFLNDVQLDIIYDYMMFVDTILSDNWTEWEKESNAAYISPSTYDSCFNNSCRRLSNSISPD